MNPIQEDLEDLLTNVISNIPDMSTMEPLRNREGKNKTIVYTITPRVFSIEFVDSSPNNLSFSWDSSRKYFKLGLKLNKKGPDGKSPMTGNEALNYMERVARQLKIPEIHIYDAAYVACVSNTHKEVEEFTILRILQGKEGFYRKPFIDYADPETAAEAIRLLREEFLTEPRQTILNKYVPESNSSACDSVNRVLAEAKEFLLAKETETSKSYWKSLHDYVLRPRKIGGYRKRGFGKKKRSRVTKRKARKI